MGQRSLSTLLPIASVMKRAWKGMPDVIFPPRPPSRGYHDAALFEPTSPPGHMAFNRLRFHLTAQYVLSLPGRRVFDTAAGACFVAACLHEAGREVVVSDIRALDEDLRPWGLSGVLEAHQGDIFTLRPEETGKFDIVVCAELIEHVAHPQELLRHLRSFISPGGHLVVTTPNGRFIWNRLPTLAQVGSIEELEKRQFQPDSDGHLFLLSPEELQDLIVGAGLDPIEILHFGSPITNGYLKFRHLSFLRIPGLWYGLERLSHRAPGPLRARLNAHLMALGRAP